MNEAQQQQDMVFLMGRPEFRRTLFRIIQEAGILASAYGSDGRNLAFAEGRRSLGFDILRWADEALPAGAHPLHVIPLMAALREEAQPQEEPNARRNNIRTRNDRTNAEPDADDFERR